MEGTRICPCYKANRNSVSRCFRLARLWCLAAWPYLQMDVHIPYRIISRNGSDNAECIAFSTKAGSAISAFKSPIVIESPRMRFVPVKTTSDLLTAQSNVYVIKVCFSQRPVPDRYWRS